MRQRNIKDLDSKLDALKEYLIEKPETIPEKLEVEIGCGKGKFITSLASDNPDTMFIGIEGQKSVLLRSLEKARDGQLENVRFISMFIDDMTDVFPDESIDRIYLNFSDPWPKARHYKRRLTYRERLKSFIRVLKPDGTIEIKTDNEDLFDFTLEEIEALGLNILHKDDDLTDAGYTTEYEDKFLKEGRRIRFVRIGK